jgi:hypothetical protein
MFEQKVNRKKNKRTTSFFLPEARTKRERSTREAREKLEKSAYTELKKNSLQSREEAVKSCYFKSKSKHP